MTLKRFILAVIALALLLAVGIGGILIGRSTNLSEQPGASEEQGSTETLLPSTPLNEEPLISTGERDAFERALNSDGSDVTASVLSELLNDAQIVRGDKILPRGSTVLIDWDTLAGKEGGFATVEASVRGPLAGRYKLLLIEEDASWKLLRTERFL